MAGDDKLLEGVIKFALKNQYITYSQYERLLKQIPLARLGAAVESLPQGVALARHGALGATKWCLTNTDDEHDSIDGDTAYEAISNAMACEWLGGFEQ